MRRLVWLATAGTAGCLTTPPPPGCGGPFGSPVALDSVNTNFLEDAPWMSRDRLEIVFSSNRDGPSHLYRATRLAPAGDFDPPQPIGFSTGLAVEDENPFVTADGRTLWFTSNRSSSTINIATRAANGDFENPRPVDELPQAAAMSLTDDQLDIYYEASVGPYDVLQTSHRAHVTDPFLAGDTIAVGFTGVGLAAPAISSDGNILLFNTRTTPEVLYRCERRDGRFGAPAIVHGVGDDYDASLTDDASIVFASWTPNGSDLYEMTRTCP